MNLNINEPKTVIAKNVDTRWSKQTIYNHYEDPIDFMNDILDNPDLYKNKSKAARLVEDGKKKFSQIENKDITYDKKYLDVAEKVKSKLISRGFTTALLYADVEFTTINTGCMSKQRALMGRRDCYFKNSTMTDGKLFHDIYINLSYSYGYSDSEIEEKSYALYALVKELSRLIPIRVFVVNHVGTYGKKSSNTGENVDGCCYSYTLKKFGLPINPKEFLFFTADSKRTFGWAYYDIVVDNDTDARVGEPTDTVSIASFNLDEEIDTIWSKWIKHSGNQRLED